MKHCYGSPPMNAGSVDRCPFSRSVFTAVRNVNLLLSMNSTNETLLFDRFLIMYDLYVFTCIIFIFVFHCTHVRMSYVLNSYLFTYLLTVNEGREHARVVCTGLKTQFNYNLSLYDIYMSEERPLKVLAGKILTRHCRQSCERVRTIMHSALRGREPRMS